VLFLFWRMETGSMPFTVRLDGSLPACLPDLACPSVSVALFEHANMRCFAIGLSPL